MTKKKYPGLFDIAERAAKLTQMGDPLVGLNERIDWEAFRKDLSLVHEKERKSNAGAKPIDVVLMFKVLVLQQLHNLSDDRIEYQIRDRLSFMRFLGLQLEDRVPDAKTVWLFREQLKNKGLVTKLFARFHEQLATQGYVAKSGQMIDATFIEVPRQRNTREENDQIKNDETPVDWQQPENKAKLRQKDVDARWTKKNEEKHYGYKNHINADQDTKLIRNYVVTDAAVHDSQAIDFLIDDKIREDGSKRDVYADSAYRSQEREAQLAAVGIPSQICEKGAHYVFGLKGNQGNLHEAVQQLFARTEWRNYADFDQMGHVTEDAGHGRKERRRYVALTRPDTAPYDAWSNLQSVIMVESMRQTNDNVTAEKRYFVSSLPPNAERLAQAIRSHWAIENQLHWCLDVTFGEDACRNRTGHAPENLNIVRKIAMNLLRLDPLKKNASQKAGAR